MSRLKQLIYEIHHRSLWQVLLIYCGGALVAYEAVQALTERLGLSDWFFGLAIALFPLGFPLAVATVFTDSTLLVSCAGRSSRLRLNTPTASVLRKEKHQ